MKIRLLICAALLMIAVFVSYDFMGTDIFLVGLIVNIGLFFTIVALGIRRLIKSKPLQQYQETQKAEKRSLSIDATVTKVENMIWKYSRVEDASLECEYVDQTGKTHVFKVSGVVGKFNVKIGDTVKVLVEPNEFSNYQIMLNDIVD